jgi:hypothetical protein
MMMRVRRWALLTAGILMLALAFCAPKDDEKALRELVEKAALLGEKHDIGGIIDLTTEDFRAMPGDMDRRGAKRILFMAFSHYGELKVVHPRPSVDLETGEGGPWVSVPFMIVKKDRTLPELKELYNDPRGWVEKVGEKADLYRFRLKVVKVKGAWLVRKAYLERFSGTGFSR